MKSESPFSRLPSISELLGHPAVSQVVKRVNQTTIAQRATGFLEELQNSLRNRLEHGTVPTLGQLAERFARRLLGPPQTALPAVNATGIVLGGRWTTLPLPEASVDEIVRVASEYHDESRGLHDRVLHQLRDLSNAEAALVVSSFETALEMVRGTLTSYQVARFAGLLNPKEYGLAAYPTILERLQGDTDLVVVDGAGLLGGPPCGIVVGAESKLTEVSRHPIASLTIPNVFILTALATTLAVYQSGEHVTHRLPVWQLLTTPLENLEQRCQRVAALMAECDKIDSATAAPCDSIWCESHDQKLTGPSWSIVLRPHADAYGEIFRSLQEATPRVVGNVHDKEIWLDFRSVFPRWDQHLVASLE